MIKPKEKSVEDQLKKVKRELVILHELDKIKESAADTPIFMNSILREVIKIMQFEMGAILLYDQQSDILNIEAVVDRGIFKQDKYALLKRIARDVLSKSRILVINDTKKHGSLRAFKIRNILVSPIRYANNTIGVFFMLNKRKGPIGRSQLHLFSLMLSHIDSTIEHSKVYQQLEERKRELLTMYTIDQLRDTISDLDTLLNAVLDEIIKVIPSKTAYISIYDKERKQSQLKVPSSMRSSSFIGRNRALLEKTCKDIIAKGELAVEREINNDIKSLMGIPLTLGDGTIAVFGVINSERESGFNEEDKRLLTAIAKQSDSAIFEDMEKAQIKNMFQRYVHPEVIDVMLNDPEKDYMKTEKRELSILFCDLRGFTEISEKLDPEHVVKMLDEFFDAMTDVILQNKGTVDKFLGDAIMAFFGAPVFYEGHALRAVKTALAMQQAQKKLMQSWRRQDFPAIQLGIGISVGDVVVGNVGGGKRTDYTVIGDKVNTASRLTDMAQGGQILITEALYQEVKKSVKAKKLAPVSLKGKKNKVAIYEIISLK